MILVSPPPDRTDAIAFAACSRPLLLFVVGMHTTTFGGGFIPLLHSSFPFPSHSSACTPKVARELMQRSSTYKPAPSAHPTRRMTSDYHSHTMMPDGRKHFCYSAAHRPIPARYPGTQYRVPQDTKRVPS
eukprot:2459696-Rhodomonas_salina.2